MNCERCGATVFWRAEGLCSTCFENEQEPKHEWREREIEARTVEVFRLHALLAEHIEAHSPLCSSSSCICNIEERREALNKLASWAAGARYEGDDHD